MRRIIRTAAAVLCIAAASPAPVPGGAVANALDDRIAQPPPQKSETPVPSQAPAQAAQRVAWLSSGGYAGGTNPVPRRSRPVVPAWMCGGTRRRPVKVRTHKRRRG